MSISIKNTLSAIAGFGLLGAIGLACYLVAKGIWTTFASFESEVVAGIIIASGTVLVSVTSVVLGRYFERRRAIEQELRKHKIPVYKSLITFMFKLFFAEKVEGKPMSEKDMQDFFYNFTQDIILWGSDEVVGKWSEFRGEMMKASATTDRDKLLKQMVLLEDLLMVIRKDAGHKNKNLKQGNLLGLFINDVSNYFDHKR